jgi:hypothetical protein
MERTARQITTSCWLNRFLSGVATLLLNLQIVPSIRLRACRKMLPIRSHPDFIVDLVLLTEERFNDTQRTCHCCSMRLWAVVRRDGELVPFGIPKRATVQREGFAVCTAECCPSKKGTALPRKIFCLECLRQWERGGGSISFEACFKARVEGGFEQLLGECLHCRLGGGIQCSWRGSDDITWPRAARNRAPPARAKKRKSTPPVMELAPCRYDWRQIPSWRDDFLFDLVNLPDPHRYLFYYPEAAPRNADFHTLRPTSPAVTYDWAYLKQSCLLSIPSSSSYLGVPVSRSGWPVILCSLPR